MNREGSRNVPLDAPTGFIRKRWENHVFAADGIDRRFYELCVMAADLAFFLNKLDGHWGPALQYVIDGEAIASRGGQQRGVKS
jgi:hypothetical protein